MAKERIAAEDIQTPYFRVQYQSVFVPRPKDPNNKESRKVYSIIMIYPKTTDIRELRQNVADVLIMKFGADKTKWPPVGDKSGQIQLPFHDGTEKDKPGFGKDVIFASAWTNFKPRVVDQERNDILAPGDFFNGCWARAKVYAFYWEYMGKMGVSFNLGNIQKVKDDEALGGGSDPKEDFDSIPVPGAAAAGAAVAGADPLGL